MPDHDNLHRLPEPDPVPVALLALADHAEQLTDLTGRIDDTGTRLLAIEQYFHGEPDKTAYSPVPAPRWWMLTAAERAAALDRLAAWVDKVYLTSGGHLARMLAPCWPEHDLCLFVLDFLSELHSVLYLRPTRSARTLADQAEFHLRILPAAADLMKAETTRCDHSRIRSAAA